MLSLARTESPSPCFRTSASPWNHLVPSRMLAAWDVLPAWLWDQGHRNMAHVISKKAGLEKKAWSKGCPVNEIVIDLMLPTTENATKFNKLMLSINCSWKEFTIRRKQYQSNKQTKQQKAPQIVSFSVKASLSEKKRSVAFSEPRPQLDQETKATLLMEGPHCHAFSTWCHQHQGTSQLSFGKNLFLMSKLRLGQQSRDDLTGEPYLLLSSLIVLLWRRWQNF